MSTANDFFVQAELALASYATLNQGTPNVDKLQDEGDGLSAIQASNFATNWTVIDQYDGVVEETYVDEFGEEHVFLNPTGLSATIFKNNWDGVGPS